MFLFTLGFTLGVAVLQQQAALPGSPAPLVLLACALLWVSRRGHHALAKPALLLGAAALGFSLAAWQADRRMADPLPEAWEGRDIEITGVVASLPRLHARGERFVFEVEHTLKTEAHVPHRLYLTHYRKDDERAAPVLHAGERWHLTVRLKRPHGSLNPHGFDYEGWLLEQDIGATGYLRNIGVQQRLEAMAGGLRPRIEHWRETLRDRFRDKLGDAPYAGVLAALAIGDQDSIPADQWQTFTRTGVNHLMSISGLHITMLSGLAFALALALWRRVPFLTLRLPAHKAAALFALATACAYALLSGFAIPAQRTLYMVTAVTVALWINRNHSPLQVLCLALLAVLIPDPWAVRSAGFWLSFGAVALILLTSVPRATGNETRRNWRATLHGYARVQWAMTLGLAPLLLALFGQFSLVSPLANAIAIPLVSLLVVPLTLLGTVLPVDSLLWLAHALLSGLMPFLNWLGSGPDAVWAQHTPPLWSVCAGLVGVFWLLLPHGVPARWLGLPLLLPLFLNTPQPPVHGQAELLIFDVGQGLAAAVRTQHHALLFDSGPDYSGENDSGNRIIVPGLRALGYTKLDTLLLSHDDIDHAGGAGSVLAGLPVGNILSSLPSAHPLLHAGVPSQSCRAGLSWNWDGVRFDILYPDGTSPARAHDNNHSCVLRISAGTHHILLVGDIEREAEARLLAQQGDRLAADLLVAAHHGSRSSSTPAFLDASHPGIVVFTAGYRNRFGHPHPEVVQRYAERGTRILRSDRDGAIQVSLSSQGLGIDTERARQRRYWHAALP